MVTKIQELGLEDDVIHLYNEGKTIREVRESLVELHPDIDIPSESSIFRFITANKPQLQLDDLTDNDIKFLPSKIIEITKRAFSDLTGNSVNSRQVTKFQNTYLKDIKADLEAVSNRALQREEELREWRSEFLNNLWLDVLLPTFETKYNNTSKDIVIEIRKKYESLLSEFLKKNSE